MAKEVTRTLLNLEPPSLYTTRTPVWNQINSILPSKCVKHPDLRRRSWRLHAEAKGFNRAPADLLQQKDRGRGKSSKRKNANDDDDEEIPEVVSKRITGRVLLYVGVPLASGVALLQIFSVMKEQNLWDVPIWLPFLTTFITFGASALGIAYGTLSTSWDPEREGTLLGFEEVQKNWVEMWNEEDE